MILRLLLRRLFGVRSPQPALPAGERIYAVGDIHGRADLLARLADLIEADCRAQPGAAVTIVSLGDYIDRGPASAAVLDRLARVDLPAPLIALRGNHDDLFLALMRGELSLGDYKQVGGAATLASYGLDLSKLKRLSHAERLDRLHAAIPVEHLAFLEGTAFSHTAGDYFFCHAGARPGVSLDTQAPEDLLWIREEFLRSDYDFGKIIVHGHTPVRVPQVRRNGLNVDTKAFATGTLTALVLEGAGRRFLQT